MNRSNSQCDLSRLEQAIANSLDAASENQLAEHLSDCDSCRDKLANFAGDDSFWSKATSNLAAAKTFGNESDSNFQSGVFAHVDRNAESAASLSAAGDFTDANEDTPFAPPTHPEMLGRIDDFGIEQVIGRGGMGIVYKGFDAELNRPVAIKFLAPHLSVSGVARKRFAREAQAAAAVVHPNVVPIYSIGTSQKRPYLVMALVSGRSLQNHVEEQGPLSAEDIVRIAQQIAAGLAAAHEQGLVHRDIKPANILLEKDVSRVLITDFGLARAADDAGLTQSGWLAGTPHYMSPEQTKGDDVDHRSDLFSLGSVMYFMATGREPFRAENPYAVLQKIGSSDPSSIRSINSAIPPTLDDIISRLLSKKPVDRFDSANSVQDVLTQYLAHLQNPTQFSRPKFRKKATGNHLLWTIIGFAVAAMVFVLLLPLVIPVATGDSTVELNPKADSRAKTSTNSPVATVSPSWITDLNESQGWASEMWALEQSIRKMEQPIRRHSHSFDAYQLEMAKLDEQIRAMERSFGIQNTGSRW